MCGIGQQCSGNCNIVEYFDSNLCKSCKMCGIGQQCSGTWNLIGCIGLCQIAILSNVIDMQWIHFSFYKKL